MRCVAKGIRETGTHVWILRKFEHLPTCLAEGIKKAGWPTTKLITPPDYKDDSVNTNIFDMKET